MSFAEIIKNKTVAIVGNATSLLSARRGNEIDSNDVVIRINLPGNIEYDESYYNVFGKKMNVWCMWNAESFINGNGDKFKNKYCRLFNDSEIYKIEAINKGVVYNNVETLCTDKSEFIKQLLSDVTKRYPIRFNRKTYNFSTGFLLINYIAKSDIKSLNIYGMDFKKTPTFYNREMHDHVKHGFDFRCGHDYTIEKKYIFDNVLKTNKNTRIHIDEMLV